MSDDTFTVKHEVRIPGTKTKWSKFVSGISSKAEANRILKAMITEAGNEKLNVTKYKEPIFIGSAMEEFLLVAEKEAAATTFEAMSTTLRKWVPFAFTDRTLESLVPDEFRSLIKEKMNRSVSQQKNLLKYLRKMFRYFEEKNYIDKSPIPHMQFRDIKKLKAVLTKEQFEKLLKLAKECENEWHPIWEFAIKIGLRNGELFALRWDQLDLINRLITVNRNWDRKGGFRDYPKSKAHRKVEFPESLLSVIKELKEKDPESIFVLPRANH